jgi:flagellar hook-basal body complex protein FliE
VIPAIGIGPLGASEWSIPGVGGLGANVPAGGAAAGGASVTGSAGSSGSFGDALTQAIGSLDASQQTATNAAEQLATGQLSDPTQAINAVENASMAMDFASQIRNQLDTAATTLFQTQL